MISKEIFLDQKPWWYTLRARWKSIVLENWMWLKKLRKTLKMALKNAICLDWDRKINEIKKKNWDYFILNCSIFCTRWWLNMVFLNGLYVVNSIFCFIFANTNDRTNVVAMWWMWLKFGRPICEVVCFGIFFFLSCECCNLLFSCCYIVYFIKYIQLLIE